MSAATTVDRTREIVAIPETPFHALTVGDALERLHSDNAGLDQTEAERRLASYGPNRLDSPRTDSALTILARQFKSIVALLLAVAACIALAMSSALEALAIAIVLALNALIGFTTEYRARRAMAALLALDVPRAVVVRAGQRRTIDAHLLVPGDVVVLSRGQHVPADGRVVDAADLRADEAPLTGESLPVSKSGSPVAPDTPLADRRNMLYKGTLVAAGSGLMAVTATGMRTEIGRIGLMTAGVRVEPTPLERRLDELGRRLVWLALGVGAFVAGAGIWQGTALALVIETGIALAVAAVPEALPAVATIALAVGVRRMALRHALVRRLPAVEALGSTTVICTDKTRTLTSGAMTVGVVWTLQQEFVLDDVVSADPTPPTLTAALEAAALASQPQSGLASDTASFAEDPVDAAVLRAAANHGIVRADLELRRASLGLLPFSSERKLMASFHRVEDDMVAYVKGAAQQVLARCARLVDGRPIDGQRRAQMLEVNEGLARRGFRVLALASGPVARADDASLTALTFIGFIGLLDPPAAGVKATIARLKRAGLRLVMLTGDQRATAEAVGREIGLLTGPTSVVGAEELDMMTPETLRDAAGRTSAFSRISPAHKLAVVRALQARGEIVAMIGDGINDAAALKQADVGVAMGRRGSDVAKEAASIVLQDDRLETIAAAVEEGRVIFDNIRKFVFYLFSCNVGEVLLLCGTSVVGWPLPLVPLQLLWLNMVTDTFPAFALAIEPGDSDVMTRPPRRPDEAVLSAAFLRRIFFYGVLIACASLAAFEWSRRLWPDFAVSIAFTTLAFAQIFHLGNARSHEAVVSFPRAVANRHALAAIALTVALQLAALYVAPLAAVLQLQPLQWTHWLMVLPLSAAPAIIGQTLKLLKLNREN